MKKILNNVLLFFFFTFAISDLVELHLRIFLNSEVTVNVNLSGKTGNTHVKVKEGKTKSKPSNHGGAPDFAFHTSIAGLPLFIVHSTLACSTILTHKNHHLCSVLIPRAPPAA